MSDPDAIRADIEATRRNLSVDVDAIADKVSPSSIAHRQTDRVKGRLKSAQESVMGAAHTTGDAAGSAAETAKGNALVVGLIAFGAGMLLASLIPASQKEQELAVQAKEKAAPVTGAVTDAVKDAAEHLKDPAAEAASSIRDQAKDAAATVREQGKSAASDVRDQAQDAKDAVQQS